MRWIHRISSLLVIMFTSSTISIACSPYLFSLNLISLSSLQANKSNIQSHQPSSVFTQSFVPSRPRRTLRQPDRAQRIKWLWGYRSPTAYKETTFRTTWPCLWLANIQQLQEMLSYLPVKIEDFLARLGFVWYVLVYLFIKQSTARLFIFILYSIDMAYWKTNISGWITD